MFDFIWLKGLFILKLISIYLDPSVSSVKGKIEIEPLTIQKSVDTVIMQQEILFPRFLKLHHKLRTRGFLLSINDIPHNKSLKLPKGNGQLSMLNNLSEH